jgi:hypothetical protein
MDPFKALGVTRDATLDEIRAAWKMQARSHHPDTGGTVQDMQHLNEALRLAVMELKKAAAGTQSNGDTADARDDFTTVKSSSHNNQRDTRRTRQRVRRVSRDVSSFTVECLPVETFEALLIAISWYGEVVLEESPYLVEAILTDPCQCWVRLDIVPEAGASMVSVIVATYDGAVEVLSDHIRDLFVTALNELDWNDIRA